MIYLLLRLVNAAFAGRGVGLTPVIYGDIAAICPELARLEEAYPVIKAEYLTVKGRLQQVPRYHEVDGLQYELSSSRSPSQNWRVFFLEAMGRKAQANRQLCPRTAALVERMPNVFQAFFSILEGGKSLGPPQSVLGISALSFGNGSAEWPSGAAYAGERSLAVFLARGKGRAL